MIGLAVYAAALAYGRVNKRFDPLAWIILVVVALVTTFAQAGMMGIPIEETSVFLALLLQAALLAAIYTVGVFVGRWLDRDKDYS